MKRKYNSMVCNNESNLNDRISPLIIMNNYPVSYLNKFISTCFGNDILNYFQINNFVFTCPLIISMKKFDFSSMSVNINNKKKFFITENELNDYIESNIPSRLTYKPIEIFIRCHLIIDSIKLILIPSLINEIECFSLIHSFMSKPYLTIHLNKEKEKSFILDKYSYVHNKIQFINIKNNNDLIYYYKYITEFTENCHLLYKAQMIKKYQNEIHKLLDIEEHWNNIIDEIGDFLKKTNKFKIYHKENKYHINYKKNYNLILYYYENMCHNNEFKKFMITLFLDHYSKFYNDFKPKIEGGMNKNNIKEHKEKIKKDYDLYVENMVIKSKCNFDIISHQEKSMRSQCYTHYYYCIEAYKIRIKNLTNE